MESTLQQTTRLLLEARNHLCLFETDVESTSSRENLSRIFSQVDGNCDRLDVYLNKEPPHRKQLVKQRIDQVKQELRHLQLSLDRAVARQQERVRLLDDREELLRTRFTTNDSTSILIDQGLTHNTKLHSAHKEMDSLLGSGGSIIGSLSNQRRTLANAQRRILLVISTLGLSNSVMKLIEGRTKQDKVLLFAGMVITCVIMYLVWSYFT